MVTSVPSDSHSPPCRQRGVQWRRPPLHGFRFRSFIVIRRCTAGKNNCPAGRAPVPAGSAGHSNIQERSCSPPTRPLAAGRWRAQPPPAAPGRLQVGLSSEQRTCPRRRRPAGTGSGRLQDGGGGGSSDGGDGGLNRWNHRDPRQSPTGPCQRL